jgi:hypothetical protein
MMRAVLMHGMLVITSSSFPKKKKNMWAGIIKDYLLGTFRNIRQAYRCILSAFSGR